MLRPLLKSISFLILAACAVCAQQAAPVQQPAAQPAAKRPPERMAQRAGVQGSANGQGVAAREPQQLGKVVPRPVTASTAATTQTATKTRPTKKNGKGKPVVEEVPVVEAPPPPPPTPEQMPASAPVVTYRGGLLSINSQNSTLGDILTAVKRLTGGTVEAPGTTLSERIATRLGPASPKDVLASLFSGSRFDYIILGSAQNPNGIDKIILTARQNGANAQPGGAAVPVNNRIAQVPQQATPPPDAEMDAEEDTSPDREPLVEEPANAQDQQQPENPGQAQPGGPPGAPGGPGYPNAPGAAVPPGAPNGVDQQSPNATDQQNPQQPKTPEQLLKELQDMQRQRQSSPTDQQQQENPR